MHVVLGNFVRSGFVKIYDSRLWGASRDGWDWSRDAAAFSSAVGVNTATAYFLIFDASVVYPSNINARWLGFPLRCLAL